MTTIREPYIADLHIHSRFSMATSRDCDAPHLDLSARRKGIQLVGTGDFTHPAWRAELRDMLVPAEEGLYTLKQDLRLPGPWEGEGEREREETPRFVLSGEISSIYKKNGATHKVHNVILLPGLDAAEKLALRLEAIGNIHSDGRPILGLDSRDLLEITLDACPEAIFIPAHIWTPHFSLFGAMSGFDRIEDCFEDLSGEIHALETGLSSDPPMNWRVSALDRFTLVSNSDAHSPAKLGREGNLISGDLSYTGLKRAIETGEGFCGTLEFFPEEGKYHLDGHRNCGARLTPEETAAAGGKCPVCGKNVTVGVQHRVFDLADRQEGYMPANAKPYESLVPLPEIIAASLGTAVGGKRTVQVYERMLAELGPEFPILRTVSVADIERVAGKTVGEGVRRLRAGKVERIPGYDGEFGSVVLFTEAEREALSGQISLLGEDVAPAGRKGRTVPAVKAQKAEEASVETPPPETRTAGRADALNPAQQEAVHSEAHTVAVVAGPGTGKTKTLVARIAYLVEEKKIDPGRITAVTFTNQAAKEMRTRLAARLGQKTAKGLTVGTFHAICLGLLDKKPILNPEEQLDLLSAVLKERQSDRNPKDAFRALSRMKNGCFAGDAGDLPEIAAAYAAVCAARGVRDMDDLLLDGLKQDRTGRNQFDYLLVDEYQDINPIQRKLVEHWAEGGESLFVIGDPDQSIYGFRGASAGCFEELAAAHPDMHRLTLAENYRSTPEILSAALSVIARNPGGERALLPNRPSGRKVRVMREKSAFGEAVWIAKEIGRLTGGTDMASAQAYERERKELRAFLDVAVLTRTHRQLELIETCLRHDGIPCVVTGRGPELEAGSVRGALGFFTFLLDGQDGVALDACLNHIWNLPKGQRASLTAAFLKERETGETASFPSGCPAGLRGDMEAFLPLMKAEKPRRLLERWTMAHGTDDAMERLMDIAGFYPTMSALLSALTLGEEDDIRRASGKSYASGAVRLSTLHGAKGLEFPVVFVAGLTEGTFPMERAGEQVDLTEERRLFFVGVTRAREELLVSGSAPLSPFLKELPADVENEKAAPQKAKQLSLF